MKKDIVSSCLLVAICVFAAGCGSAENKSEKKTVETAVEDESHEYEVTEISESDYSKWVGDWYVDGSLENGHLSIDAEGNVVSYSYDDMVNYEGKLKREEYENPDGTTGYLYNIYDGSELVIGFYEPEEENFYELYSGQDGAVHYVKSDYCTEGSDTDETSSEDGWKAYYGSLIQNWEKDHENDYIHGYKLFYLNDDDIPEIALIGCEEWTLCDIHSYVDETAIKVYSADNLGVDGNGLCYYDRSDVIVTTKWNAGIGEYVFYEPMNDPDGTVYCKIVITTEDSLAGKPGTDVEYISPNGDTYSNHYDKEFDLSDLPEKNSIEEALLIKDISDIKRLDNEDGLMDYDTVNKELDK